MKRVTSKITIMKKTHFIGAFLWCLNSFSFGQFNTPWTTTTSNATSSGYIGIGIRPLSTSTSLPNFNFQVHGIADYIVYGGSQSGLVQGNELENESSQFENFQFESSINYGKTSRIGLTNSVTGLGASDGTVLMMAQNDFFIKNQELGNFTLSTAGFSVLLHNSSKRIWVGGTPSAALTYGKLNLISPDNGLYIETFGSSKKGLIVKSYTDASTAIEIFGANATRSNFRVYASGLVRAREVIIDLAAWPDYVFMPGYKLKPLKEIEVFINKHGHLPGVPSADEVANEGVSLGEMNKILLEKIEELTLHLIEQQKRIEALEAKK